MDQKLPGVFTAHKKDGSIYYRSSITYKRKHISLGSYDTAPVAYAAYLEGTSLVFDAALTLHDHSAHRVLPFNKWVSLINFRDNHIYFSTPIYMRKNYFEYYLSPSEIFKFDFDDLFYYSSHKIMKRITPFQAGIIVFPTGITWIFVTKI